MAIAAVVPTLMAPLDCPLGEAEGALEPAEPLPEALGAEEPLEDPEPLGAAELELLLEVLLAAEDLAAAWKASKVLSAVGFRANTIP